MIGIVHASRGRADLAFQNYNDVIKKAELKDNINYYLSIDLDDPDLQKYKNLFILSTIKEHTNRSGVEAVNRFYTDEVLKNDIIILNSDDMVFPENWDTSIIDIFNRNGYDKILKTKQPGGRDDLIAIQIAGNMFWKGYGFFFCPEYISMYSDDDLTAYAKMYNKYIENMNLIFIHNHPNCNLETSLKWDDTYYRENEGFKYTEGYKIFQKRKQSNFK